MALATVLAVTKLRNLRRSTNMRSSPMVRYFEPSNALARSRIHLDRSDQLARRTQISPEKHASRHFTLGWSATRKLRNNGAGSWHSHGNRGLPARHRKRIKVRFLDFCYQIFAFGKNAPNLQHFL